MSDYPESFDSGLYITWHEETAEQGVNLIEVLNSKREALKDNKERLKKLSTLLDTLNTILIRAKQTSDQDTSMLKCDVMLSDQLGDDKYEDIFKSTESVIDKLWRKNKDTDDYITTLNIQERIKDLVRSSVIVSSHSYASDFCKALKDWKTKFEINAVALDDYSDISNIIVEQEAKMASGYFAYHVDVVYSDGVHIEIQIYSQLNEVWRKLSHKLYEKTRLNQDVTHGHGTSASRLVSLGHLLHLAECEAERLQSDLNVE
ncbi:hypothetical protein [Psychromonas sp. Urea-02u-13]|uniref:hypothetical protein n=1 Tax=Psychromonas sp. Urea-02u-13 TaxID=2058326 RepID=UPI000C321EDD|nr:hypothetical protein [Psychromonas sp. Urea-02u-13]PKG36985.1 hypothetical protein CXF74_21280 [Psychromonas sp. Urea-02u-13]